MIVLPNEQLLIFTPPHTAGSNLHRALCQSPYDGVWTVGFWDHAGEQLFPDQHAVIDSDLWVDYRRVLIWRDPWDRLAGLWRHYTWAVEHLGHVRLSWEDFCAAIAADEPRGNLWSFYRRNLASFVRTAKLDTVVRYDHLRDDLHALLGYAVPLAPATPIRPSQPGVTDAIRQQLAEWAAPDYAILQTAGTPSRPARPAGDLLERPRVLEREPAGASPRLRWISRSDVGRDLQRLLHALPSSIAGVAGIPRSGLWVATELALRLNVPLYECTRDGHLRPMDHGGRLDGVSFDDGPIVVLEDSVYEGHSLIEVLPGLRTGGRDVLTASLYCTADSLVKPDLVVREIAKPYLMEYHFPGSHFARQAAWDLDVLRDSNDMPLVLPRPYPCGAIVSTRPEADRREISDWLAEHGVAYDTLLLRPTAPLPSTEGWKAHEFSLRTGLRWYLAGDALEAETIAEVARKTTIHVPTGQVFGAEHTTEL